MNQPLFARFAPVIQSLTPAELQGAPSLNHRLRLCADGELEICYAPIEHFNARARVVIVGITPGKTQWLNAIRAARSALDAGADAATALKAAKDSGAFSGAMRSGLIELLDSVGLGAWLGLGSCADLFGVARHLVHSTSALRNPVFVAGNNYNGNPSMLRHPMLCEHLLGNLALEALALPRAVFVPLGGKAAEALAFLAQRGVIDESRIVQGLPHPSPANAERIAYFLGRKPRSRLSVKTDPDKLDLARAAIVRRVAALGAA